MSDSDDAYGPALPPGLGTPTVSEKTAIIGPVIPSQLKTGQHHTSDSDTSSSESDAKHKVQKKTKKKKRKCSSGSSSDNVKKKKQKHTKKVSSSDSETSSSGSNSSYSYCRNNKQTSKHKTISFEISEGRPSIGPILPGDLKGVTNNKDSARRIGPAWPQRLGSSQVAGGSDSDDDIGPSIGLQAQEEDLSAVREFTARANRMKDKLEDEVKPVDGPAQRESWMTELPEGLGARFGLGARQFRKEEAAEIDSSWTDKPGEHKKEGKKRSHDFTTEADMKAAKEMEKFNKKHRAESLLELHKKELKKKKKKEKKKNKGRERPLERQVFDRERDLKVNKLDEAQRRAIIKRSQELGSRFKSGGTGTSFL